MPTAEEELKMRSTVKRLNRRRAYQGVQCTDSEESYYVQKNWMTAEYRFRPVKQQVLCHALMIDCSDHVTP
jgi:hypothetical protein